MTAVQKILCPVDFSESAEHALRIAVDMADRFQAEVCLLHVYQLPAYAMPQVGAPGRAPADIQAEMPRQLREMLQAVAERHKRPGVTIRTELVEGVPYQEIVDYAQQSGVDLIVMGTHGRTGLSHLLIGSVAERVVRTSTCPVLSVRAPAA